MGRIGKNTIFMQFYLILPDIPSFIQRALNVKKIVGDFSVASDNHKLLIKFHSGTLRIYKYKTHVAF